MEVQTIQDKWIEYRNSAISALSRERYDDAENFWLRAAEEARRQQKTARIRISLVGLFSLYWQQQQPKRAIGVGNELLQVYEQILGKESTDVGIMSKSLGQLHQSLAQYKAAAAHYKIALHILKQRLSYVDPALTELRKEYTRVLKEIGREEAVASIRFVRPKATQDFSPPAAANKPDHVALPVAKSHNTVASQE
jgi:tetratricopeptide (TPR) repeat protein